MGTWTRKRLQGRWILVGAIAALAAAGGAYTIASAYDPTFQELPPGLWRVVETVEDQALLGSQAEVRLGVERPRPETRADAPTSAETVVVSGGAVGQRGRATRVPVALPARAGEAGERATAVQVARLGAREVAFTRAGDGPVLRRSPAEAGEYVFAEADQLWLYGRARGAVRLTADEAGGFRRAELARRMDERPEYGRSLLWAAEPLWSSDGRSIAFVTNREGVAAGRAGEQSVWIRDVAGGEERPLLAAPGVSYAPFGWVGGSLALTRSDAPGIHSVDPASGALRKLADGDPLAVSPAGDALAYLEDGRIRILRNGESRDLPAAPAGHVYTPFAAFSPGGGRLAVVAAGADGSRQLGVFDAATGQVAFQPLPSRPGQSALLDPPAWAGEGAILVNVVDQRTGEPRSQLLRIPSPAR
jgi:hypothetical protein